MRGDVRKERVGEEEINKHAENRNGFQKGVLHRKRKKEATYREGTISTLIWLSGCRFKLNLICMLNAFNSELVNRLSLKVPMVPSIKNVERMSLLLQVIIGLR